MRLKLWGFHLKFMKIKLYFFGGKIYEIKIRFLGETMLSDEIQVPVVFFEELS